MMIQSILNVQAVWAVQDSEVVIIKCTISHNNKYICVWGKPLNKTIQSACIQSGYTVVEFANGKSPIEDTLSIIKNNHK